MTPYKIGMYSRLSLGEEELLKTARVRYYLGHDAAYLEFCVEGGVLTVRGSDGIDVRPRMDNVVEIRLRSET